MRQHYMLVLMLYEIHHIQMLYLGALKTINHVKLSKRSEILQGV